MHVLRQKGRGRKKKKKRRKKRLPRSPRPRPVSGCCLRSTRSRLLRTAWFYSGYMFLPRSRRLRGTISTLFLRESGPWLLRSILAATCLQARDAPHLGQYDQKDSYLARVLQCHVQGLFCWFLHLALYSSSCSQAHDALHHGRYGPEGQLFGESLAVACTMLGFSGVSAPRAVCPVFGDVPRAVFPFLSSGPRCPSSWLAWTTGQMEVHRCSSWTRFSTCPLLCYVWCHGPDSAVYCLAFPQLQFITVISSPSWRRGLPYSSDCSADHGDSTVAVSTSLLCRIGKFVGCRRGEDSRVSHCSRSRVQTWRTRLRSHSCSSSTLVYVQDWFHRCSRGKDS